MSDRVFLDANVLFSAAYVPDAGLAALWKLKDITLLTSQYALQEAMINLAELGQRERLSQLAKALKISSAVHESLPLPEIDLPEKDVPIMAGAIHAQATHLLTGDVRHFGKYFGKKIAGIIILLPGEYLRKRLSS